MGAVARTLLRETPVQRNRTCVGLDVHARSVWACAVDDESGEMRTQRISPKTAEIVKWARGLPGPTLVAYEAGPTGFGLARALIAAGVACEVLAPSKMDRPSGDRVKTDRRDAEWIARLVRIGELPVVVIPSEPQEAARDLVRAREDVRGDLMRARHRLSKLLLRQGFVYEDTAWTGTHEKWLRGMSFDRPGVQFAFDEAFDAVLTTTARRGRLDKQIELMAAEPAWSPVVSRLGCLRGVSTLTGFGLAVEIGDWHRFTGNSIGSFLGLTPSEYSSGDSRKVGSITKAGNGHARRLLVESSWHHKKRLRLSADMRRRRDGQSPEVRARADLANRRLHHRWQQLEARKKPPTIAAVAVARELAGWCWSLAVMDGANNNSAMNRQG